MQAFAIVRDIQQLRPGSSLLDLLGSPHLAEHATRNLLGVWIEAGEAEQLPMVLPLPGSATAQVRIVESASLSGNWMLCWCESTIPGRPVTRDSLLQALSAASESGVFAPVFAAGVDVSEVGAEVSSLRRLAGDRVVSPLFQHPQTAALAVETP